MKSPIELLYLHNMRAHHDLEYKDMSAESAAILQSLVDETDELIQAFGGVIVPEQATPAHNEHSIA